MGQEAPGRERLGRGPARHALRQLGPPISDSSAAVLTTVAREEGGRLLALLADRVGGLDAAEESLQEAYARASAVWERDGVPDRPAAWVYTVARNAGIDRLRRAQASANRVSRQARVLDTGVERAVIEQATTAVEAPPDPTAEYSDVGDEQLRLMLLCCHPALSQEAQVALMLRLAGGLTTEEIAAAYLVPPATIAQRIVRAKKKIRAARIPLTIPADLSTRASALATVLGLVFNEGYLAHSGTAGTLTRADLADQAIRLTAAAADALPDEPELGGLLALQLFHRSREAARTDLTGALVPLAEQDRSLWNRADIARGHTALAYALSQRALGPWQIQAMIAAEHTRDETDWARIVRYYDRLRTLAPSAIVDLNRAVAVAEVDGPHAGLEALERIGGLDGYHLWHTTRAHLLERVGRGADALVEWERAADLTDNPGELAYLRHRIGANASTGRDHGPMSPDREI